MIRFTDPFMCTVGTYNSPPNQKAKADVVCTAKDATEKLQAAADKANEEGDELVLVGGFYYINKTLTTHCPVRAIGDVRLWWKGPKTDDFVVHHMMTPGKLGRPHLSGIGFYCGEKARGLLVDDVHGVTISDIRFVGSYGLAMQVLKGWQVHLKNVAAEYSTDSRAFDLQGFSASTIEGMVVGNMTTRDGPMVSVVGGASMDQIGFGKCDSGEYPMMRVHTAWGGRITGLHAEYSRCQAIVHVDKSFGVNVGPVYHWQKPDQPIRYAVLVTDSEACTVSRVKAYNISKAIVHFDEYSSDHSCRAPRELVREGYGQDAGTQPRHIVVHEGRGKQTK